VRRNSQPLQRRPLLLLSAARVAQYRGGLRYQIAAALEEFHTFAAACKVPEIHTLATTVDTWQQPIIDAIDTGLSNARSDGYNRIVKHIGRIACGFRNSDNHPHHSRMDELRAVHPLGVHPHPRTHQTDT